ncbi:competence protein [Sulfitobacter sp. SK012]|uniref:ComEC/Rec2 family competence protein n=1 Tax=Sulfitobacter sp. SK012 TaxID=1389005 RepID=UPI000E0A583F|nr:ComEC/Rec2 family competence protein [Sulfitobacter sp. SK012]AXI46155.1 competence protein [Sulfitobacter sp. SK012]
MGLRHMFLMQRGALFGWVPVCLAVGIGTFFNLTWEPSPPLLIGLAAAALLAMIAGRFSGELLGPVFVAIGLVVAGFVLAGVRTNSVAEPVLGWRYYGPVEGRIIAIDRSQSDALRLTLDRVVLARVGPDKTPARVRISLHGDRSDDIAAEPGLRVMTTGHLSPPSGPVEPDGFDFQRHAWFVQLGAVGYTRVPLMGIERAQQGQAGLAVFRIRMAASARIQAVLPGDIGGFAAAITTGDRSAMSASALDALRASNLAHLLAISGLHMGLLSGVVFAGLRILFALIPYVALRMPARSMAAGGALIASAGYLALSGGNVSTERAFIMVAVALCALMLGRRAISLRAVAIAAIIVLVLRPEALMGPGFQMSFAATTALVAVFGWLRDADLPLGPAWLRPVIGVVMSSAIAGFATAPIAAAHFNAFAQYGLIANVVSVPLMGVLVIPAAVVAVVLAPLGLEFIGLQFMRLGLRWILWVAHGVAGWDGARSYVVGPGPWVLPLLTLGFLFAVLWQGRLRWAGGVAIALSFVLWQGATRPALLIADTGTLVGVMTAQGRALSKPKGAGFVARNWLENDGDGSDQLAAAARWKLGALGDVEVIHLSGKRAAAKLARCGKGQIVVASVAWEGAQGKGCTLFEPDALRETGSIAFIMQDGALIKRTSRAAVGDRLWTNWPKARRTKRVASKDQ